MTLPVLSLALGLLCAVSALRADPAPPDPAAEFARMRQLSSGLKPMTGNIVLPDNIATIAVPQNFRYLSAKDAETVLVGIWGNPKQKSLGMIVPVGFDPLARGGWAVDITYSPDGYIKDDDAAEINYAKLLDQMRTAVAEANKERVKQGYPAVELVGWASPPRYDAATHKLYWAKEVKFSGARVNTLNYNIRMLGRQGVLVLNVIGGMPQLAEIERATPAILGMVNFNPGHRYADFDSSTDKVATYGLAALVVGGIAAKAGLFKVVLAALLAAKKLVLMAAVAVSAFFKKHFKRRKAATADPAASLTPPSA